MSSGASEKKYSKTVDDAIFVNVSKTVLETEGVAGFATSFTDVIAKNLQIKDPLHKGAIRVSKGDEGYTIDIYINVMYEVNIPSIAWDLQKSIKKVLTAQLGISVQTINVHVQGVKFPNVN